MKAFLLVLVFGVLCGCGDPARVEDEPPVVRGKRLIHYVAPAHSCYLCYSSAGVQGE